MQEGTETLGEREHPLARREVGQHVIREMGGELGHAARVAGGADAPALAGERDQALVAAVLTAGASEPVRQDAAAQVSTEVLLDPPGNTVAQGIDLRGLGEQQEREHSSRPP